MHVADALFPVVITLHPQRRHRRLRVRPELRKEPCEEQPWGGCHERRQPRVLRGEQPVAVLSDRCRECAIYTYCSTGTLVKTARILGCITKCKTSACAGMATICNTHEDERGLESSTLDAMLCHLVTL